MDASWWNTQRYWMVPGMGCALVIIVSGLVVWVGGYTVASVDELGVLRVGDRFYSGDLFYKDWKPETVFADAMGRIHFGLASVMTLVACLLGIVYAPIIGGDSLADKGIKARPVMKKVICTGACVGIVIAAMNIARRVSFGGEIAQIFWFDIPLNVGGLRVQHLMLSYGGTSIWAIICIVFAFSCLLVAPRGGDARDLLLIQRDLARCRKLLYVSSILLVAGTMHIYTAYMWPSAMVAKEWPAAKGLASTFSGAAGGILTLMLLSVYVPTLMLLIRKARGVARGKAEEALSPAEEEAWLKENGILSGRAWNKLPHIFAALAPFIAGGPVASLLDNVVF